MRMKAKVKSISIDENASEDFLAKLDLGLDDVAEAVLSLSQDLVAVDEGMLKKSGHVESEFLEKHVAYDTPYAEDIEYGTDPHPVPFSEIRAWVYRKRADFGLKETEIDDVAYAIKKKIESKGTQPQPFLRPAFDEVDTQAAEIIRAHLR